MPPKKKTPAIEYRSVDDGPFGTDIVRVTPPTTLQEFRKRARIEIPELIASVKPILIHIGEAGARDVETNGRIVLSFNLETIKRESAAHHHVIEELLCLLEDQAEVANRAVALALAEIGTNAKRNDNGEKGAAERRRIAQEDREKRNALVDLLQLEARRLRGLHPDATVKEIRKMIVGTVAGVNERYLDRYVHIPKRKSQSAKKAPPP